MEQWLNLRDDIYTEYHEDILDSLVMPNGVIIFFKRFQGFHKRHIGIIKMLEERFDMEELTLEISASLYQDTETFEETFQTRMLIEIE